VSLSVSVGAVELDGDTPCGGRGGVARATRGAARSFWFDFAVLSVFFFPGPVCAWLRGQSCTRDVSSSRDAVVSSFFAGTPCSIFLGSDASASSSW